MKYMLLIYLDENSLTDGERETCYAESAQLARDLDVEGYFLDASPLKPTSSAASIRVRGGKPLMTEGPFAETREQLGGYFMIEARDMQEASRIATRIPGARHGTVEIRPVLEVDGVPDRRDTRLARESQVV
jgi:hypothetical protein